MCGERYNNLVKVNFEYRNSTAEEVKLLKESITQALKALKVKCEVHYDSADEYENDDWYEKTWLGVRFTESEYDYRDHSDKFPFNLPVPNGYTLTRFVDQNFSFFDNTLGSTIYQYPGKIPNKWLLEPRAKYIQYVFDLLVMTHNVSTLYGESGSDTMKWVRHNCEDDTMTGYYEYKKELQY